MSRASSDMMLDAGASEPKNRTNDRSNIFRHKGKDADRSRSALSPRPATSNVESNTRTLLKQNKNKGKNDSQRFLATSNFAPSSTMQTK